LAVFLLNFLQGSCSKGQFLRLRGKLVKLFTSLCFLSWTDRNSSFENLSLKVAQKLTQENVNITLRNGKLFSGGFESEDGLKFNTVSSSKTIHIAHSFPHFGGAAARLHGSTLYVNAILKGKHKGDEILIDSRILQEWLDEISESYHDK
jgi:hypothetical protein